MACPEDTPSPPSVAFADVMTRAIASVVKSEAQHSVGWNDGNVLCRGFRRAKGPSRGGGTYNAFQGQGMPHGVEAVYPNTVVEGVKFSADGAWDALLQRIGEARMLRLLTQCYVFIHVPDPSRGKKSVRGGKRNSVGGTYVQLCGRPLASRIWRVGRMMKLNDGANKNSMHAGERGSTQASEKRSRQAGENKSMRAGEKGSIQASENASSRRPAQGVGSRACRSVSHACKLTVGRSRVFFNPAFPNRATLGFRPDHALVLLCQRSRGSSEKLKVQAMALLRLAFYGKPPSKTDPRPRSRLKIPRGIRKGVLPVLEAFLLKVQRALRMASRGKCPVTALLRLHCGVGTGMLEGTDAPRDAPLEGKALLRSFCSVPQVLSFLWATLRLLMPTRALGDSPTARQALRLRLNVFLGQRRYEKWNAEQAALGVPLSSFPWLFQWESSSSSPSRRNRKEGCSPTETARAHARLLRWVHFVYDTVCVPLLAAHFYVTDSEAYRMQVFYYRKTVWAGIAQASIQAMCTPHPETGLALYAPVAREEASMILRNPQRRLGLANLRLLPKSWSDVRPIVSLNRRSSNAGLVAGTRVVLPREFEAVNQTLGICLASLRCEIERDPSLRGSSVTGMDDQYKRLAPWIRACKSNAARRRTMDRDSSAAMDLSCRLPPASGKYYFLVADVAKAYDSLLQPRVMDVVDTLLGDYDYDEIRYVAVRAGDAAAQYKYERRAVPVIHHVPFLDFVADQVLAREGRPPAILTDGVSYGRITRTEVRSLLQELVTGTLVRGPAGKLYRQQLGICQGSNVGTLLCSAYLAHLEKSHGMVPTTASGGAGSSSSSTSVLVRQVDDFLFATDSLPAARAFAAKVAQGFPDYGCYFNVSKTVSNFDLGEEQQSTRPWVDPDGREYVRWCGLMIDTSTLGIRADYTRYMSMNVSTTLSVDGGSSPGAAMVRKLCAYLRPKAHALFFDTALNGVHVASVNVYQNFYVCALKFHAYVVDMRKMAVGPRDIGATGHTAAFHLAAIVHAVRYFCVLVRNRIDRMHPHGAVCNLHTREIQWLGFTAFAHVLARKHGHHTRLLPLLLAAARKREGHSMGGCIRPSVKAAADATATARLFESVMFG